MELVKFHSPSGAYIPVRSPLLSIATLQSVLYRDEKEITRLIDDGSLLFAFDVKCRAASRRNLRISTQSLVDYVTGEKTQIGLDLDQVLQTIFSVRKPNVSAANAARIFSCSADHIRNLIQEGSLKEFSRRNYKNQSAQISRECLVGFLKKRRVI
jgi:hypothetical protein